MNALRGEIGRTLRLLVAAVMLLAALGASRLQGEAASRQVLSASLGLSLCSGEHVLPDGSGGDAPRHAHCALCTLPFAADVAACQPDAISRFARPMQFALAAPSFETPDLEPVYQSRGPPVLG